MVDPNTWYELRLVMSDDGVTFQVDGAGPSFSNTQIIFNANDLSTTADDVLRTCAAAPIDGFAVGNNTNAWMVGASNETGDGGASEIRKPFTAGAVDHLSIRIQ